MRMQTPCPANQRHKMAPASSWPLLRHTARMVSYGALSRKSSIPEAWREHLARPRSAYAWSSFMYTLVGLQSLLLWTSCPAAVSEWPQRIARPEAVLVTLQGIWSFYSDVLYVGLYSSFHTVDRLSALTLTGFQILKFGIVLPWSMSLYELAWVWCGLALGIHCKLRGYRAVIDSSVHSFRIWHIAWHCSFPITFLAFHGYRWHVCDACAA